MKLRSSPKKRPAALRPSHKLPEGFRCGLGDLEERRAQPCPSGPDLSVGVNRSSTGRAVSNPSIGRAGGSVMTTTDRGAMFSLHMPCPSSESPF